MWIGWWALSGCLSFTEEPPRCGDGNVEGDEACDNGDNNADDAECTAECQLATCGDDLVWAGAEACDLGEDNADDGECTSACQTAQCGDGLVWAKAEDCDEGAANADDAACTSECRFAVCGDGLVHAGVEECDEGVLNADDQGCRSDCTPAECGDGNRFEADEECDDGNGFGGDGCGPGCRLPQSRDLAESDASFIGEEERDRLRSAAAAGDVDGDGRADLIFGAYRNGEGGVDAGAAYLFYGTPNRALDLANADAKLVGEPGDIAGAAAVGIGDIDGDMFDDVVVSAVTNDAGGDNSGVVYLMRGPLKGTVNLSTAHATLVGEKEGDLAGQDAGPAGDVNDDGVPDILVGTHRDDVGGDDAGALYVVFGPVKGTFDLGNANAKLIGEAAGDWAGFKSSGGRDVNGDGRDDILVGARNAGGFVGPGAAYLVYGPPSGTTNLATADVKFTGEGQQDLAGSDVALLGDVDGDGLDDLLIAAESGDTDVPNVGLGYVFANPTKGERDLGDADTKLIGPSDSGGGILLGR